MSGEVWIARNPAELALRLKRFAESVEQDNDWPICWQAKKYTDPRSLDQNALINTLYGVIAEQAEGEGVVDIRRRCKLHYGVPILRAHDEEFRTVYDKMVKPHSYVDKLLIMDYLPVTSRMKKEWASEYIDTVVREFAEQGYSLGVQEVA